MFYLLHGDDEFSSREQLKKLRQQGNFEYNQDTFDGGEVNLATITAASNTMPFLADQRLVVVEGLPKKRRGESATSAPGDESGTGDSGTGTGGKGGKAKKGKRSGKGNTESRASFEKGLAEYIPHMPDTSVLIVLVDELLDANNPLLKAAGEHGKVNQSTLPRGGALESWISKRAKSLGVTIDGDAATLLANFIGNQLRLLANELDKLATYVGDGGTITVDDVRTLSAQVQEARIFDLTDALAQRNQKQALTILHDLLADGEPPIKLISTISSQVRSLLLVKELSQQGMRSPQIASTLGIAPFVADKAARQVGKFTAAQLEVAYRQLLATDASLKRSRMTPEMLVVSFGRDTAGTR
ncbi:MAG: DNA polymerase III subunit delta [Ktedonobacter sp. 13_1_40CM_4_52_4]|nr:MAG: DNA polymerase III subunit delta [Ktedonobacter sp. 13_1_40CM_4_52_4]